MIWESIKIVLKEFRLNKLRTFLTMLGIIIGIFSITIIFSLSNSVAVYMTDQFNSLDYETIQIQVFGMDGFQMEQADNDINEYVKKNDKISNVTKINYFEFEELDNLILDENQEYYTSRGNNSYIGIDENYIDMYPNYLSEDKLLYGRYLDKKDIINRMPYIVIREDCALALFHRKDVVGKKLTINNVEVEIIGVTKQVEEGALIYIELDAIYASYYFVNDVINSNKAINGCVYNIETTKSEYSSEVETEIKKLLKNYGDDHFTVFSLDLTDALQEIDTIVTVVKLVFGGIASLSIIVGGIGIMNIMLVSVSERIKETGIRMALGAKNSDIVFQFLIEGIVLTIMSGLFGMLLAFIVETVINSLLSNTPYNLKLVIDIATMIKTIIFCGILGIIFGIYPALKAGRLDPVEALKYE